MPLFCARSSASTVTFSLSMSFSASSASSISRACRTLALRRRVFGGTILPKKSCSSPSICPRPIVENIAIGTLCSVTAISTSRAVEPPLVEKRPELVPRLARRRLSPRRPPARPRPSPRAAREYREVSPALSPWPSAATRSCSRRLTIAIATSTSSLHHRLDVAPDVADLGVLRRLDLHERRVDQLRQPPRNLGLADAGRAYHDDVLRRHLVPKLLRQAGACASGSSPRLRRCAWPPSARRCTCPARPLSRLGVRSSLTI